MFVLNSRFCTLEILTKVLVKCLEIDWFLMHLKVDNMCYEKTDVKCSSPSSNTSSGRHCHYQHPHEGTEVSSWHP